MILPSPRYFMATVIVCTGKLQEEVTPFVFAVCVVADELRATTRHRGSAEALAGSATQQLGQCAWASGRYECIQQHHVAVHLPSQVARNGGGFWTASS